MKGHEKLSYLKSGIIQLHPHFSIMSAGTANRPTRSSGVEGMEAACPLTHHRHHLHAPGAGVSSESGMLDTLRGIQAQLNLQTKKMGCLAEKEDLALSTNKVHSLETRVKEHTSEFAKVKSVQDQDQDQDSADNLGRFEEIDRKLEELAQRSQGVHVLPIVLQIDIPTGKIHAMPPFPLSVASKASRGARESRQEICPTTGCGLPLHVRLYTGIMQENTLDKTSSVLYVFFEE